VQGGNGCGQYVVILLNLAIFLIFVLHIRQGSTTVISFTYILLEKPYTKKPCLGIGSEIIAEAFSHSSSSSVVVVAAQAEE